MVQEQGPVKLRRKPSHPDSEVVLTRDEGSSAASRAAAGCREFSHGPAAAED